SHLSANETYVCSARGRMECAMSRSHSSDVLCEMSKEIAPRGRCKNRGNLTPTPMGKMIFTVLADVAELERNLFKEGVQMGIGRARKQGKQLGRPKRIFDREKARMLLHSMSIREAARQLGVSRGVIQRALVD